MELSHLVMFTPSTKQDKDLYPTYGWPYLDPTSQQRNQRKNELHDELNEIREKLGLPLKEKEEVNIKILNPGNSINNSSNSTNINNELSNDTNNNTNNTNSVNNLKNNRNLNVFSSKLETKKSEVKSELDTINIEGKSDNDNENKNKNEFKVENSLNNVNIMRKMMNNTEFYIQDINKNNDSNTILNEDLHLKENEKFNLNGNYDLNTKDKNLHTTIIKNLKKRDSIIKDKMENK